MDETSSPKPAADPSTLLGPDVLVPPPAVAGAAPSDGYRVKLDAFEGPLDLLLYMIRRDEIDIWNIPIARITEEYLGYVRVMQDLNLNVAGEFLVVAATLIHIKSRMLLPPDPEQAAAGAAEDDPRHELVYQLLEHQKFKNAAQMLYAKEAVELAVWSHPPPEFIAEGEALVTVTLFDLVRAYRDIVERFKQRVTLEYHREEVTVEEKIAQVRQRLLVQDRIEFASLFESARSRHVLVVTFLAVLELVRLGEVGMRQERPFGEIFLQNATREARALEMGAVMT